MNTIIIYSSKYGSTADCVRYLEAGLSGVKTIVDIDKTNPGSINLDAFDTVIIGSSIYVGAVSKKIRALCKEHVDLLLKKRVGIFLCCGFSEQSKEYLSKNFPDELVESAVMATSFGGEARQDKMSGLDKLIMKAAMKENSTDLKISQHCMDEFVKRLSA